MPGYDTKIVIYHLPIIYIIILLVIVITNYCKHKLIIALVQRYFFENVSFLYNHIQYLYLELLLLEIHH